MEACLPRQSSSLFRVLIFAGLLLFSVGALLPLFAHDHSLLPAVIRWIGIAFLAAAGTQRSSLTFWIFFAMFAGLEIGLDQPPFAIHLRFLSDIFLRLIKVIVAPLILGTLITGIAGHSDLKKVGRIGLRSLIYFEVVTTVALFIGLAAINISRAGVGLVLPAASALEVPQTAVPLKWDE